MSDTDFRVYSPWELPANTAAAQAFNDLLYTTVDPTLELDADRQAQANEAIQDSVDQMAAMGVAVEDPRLGGGGDGGGGDLPPGPAVIAVNPSTGPANKATHIVVTGVGLTTAQQVFIGSRSCHNTVVNDDTSIDTDTDGGTNAGTYPLTVRMQDTSVLTGPDFTYV